MIHSERCRLGSTNPLGISVSAVEALVELGAGPTPSEMRERRGKLLRAELRGGGSRRSLCDSLQRADSAGVAVLPYLPQVSR